MNVIHASVLLCCSYTMLYTHFPQNTVIQQLWKMAQKWELDVTAEKGPIWCGTSQKSQFDMVRAKFPFSQNSFYFLSTKFPFLITEFWGMFRTLMQFISIKFTFSKCLIWILWAQNFQFWIHDIHLLSTGFPFSSPEFPFSKHMFFSWRGGWV